MPHSPYHSADDDLDEDIFGDEDEDILGLDDDDDDLLGDDDDDLLGDDDDDILGDDDDDILGDDDDDLLGDDDDDLLGDDDYDLLGDDEIPALERDVDTYGLGHDDDDMWDDMMRQADSGPQGYSTTALSYMSPVEIEDDLLSPHALQEFDPMGEFGGDEDDDEDEFAAEMQVEEAEEFGVIGLIAVAAASMFALPTATTATLGVGTAAGIAAGGGGIVALIAVLAGAKKKYLRVTARLTRLAEKDKMDSPKWARNAGRLRATWRRLKRKGKTAGMQSPTKILQALRGGSRSPVFRQGSPVAAEWCSGNSFDFDELTAEAADQPSSHATKASTGPHAPTEAAGVPAAAAVLAAAVLAAAEAKCPPKLVPTKWHSTPPDARNATCPAHDELCSSFRASRPPGNDGATPDDQLHPHFDLEGGAEGDLGARAPCESWPATVRLVQQWGHPGRDPGGLHPDPQLRNGAQGTSLQEHLGAQWHLCCWSNAF